MSEAHEMKAVFQIVLGGGGGGSQTRFQAQHTLNNTQKNQLWFIGLGDVVIACFLERHQRSCSLWRQKPIFIHNHGCFLEAERLQVPAKKTPGAPGCPLG